jgi:hypothetical protein
LRNKILCVYTENLNFFYKLNKELNRLNIKFKILSGISKILDIPSLLLTTSEDILNFKANYKKLKFLIYNEKNDFKHYILKVLAAFRIGYKDYYSDLVFSIDPGSKKIGMVVFLDDYYLISQTFYNRQAIIDFIRDYINCFQIDNPNLLTLTFKFGSGVLPLTLKLIEEIFHQYQSRNQFKIMLINESKSSKNKIQDIKKRFRTKHELSALILALRSGVEINQSDFYENLEQNKFHDPGHLRELNNTGEFNGSIINIQEILDKILKNEISLSESSSILH